MSEEQRGTLLLAVILTAIYTLYPLIGALGFIVTDAFSFLAGDFAQGVLGLAALTAIPPILLIGKLWWMHFKRETMDADDFGKYLIIGTSPIFVLFGAMGAGTFASPGAGLISTSTAFLLVIPFVPLTYLLQGMMYYGGVGPKEAVKTLYWNTRTALKQKVLDDG